MRGTGADVVGNAEASTLDYISEVEKRYPEARWVFVFRDPADSLRSYNAAFPELALTEQQIADRDTLLHATASRLNGLCVEFNDLNIRGRCDEIHQYCTGRPMDASRWRQLARCNIQADRQQWLASFTPETRQRVAAAVAARNPDQPPSVTIRAGIDDIPRILPCARKFTTALGYPLDEQGFVASVQDMLGQNAGAVFLLEAAGEIVGGIGGGMQIEPIGGRRIAVETFWFVDEAYRGTIGSLKLLSLWENWARQADAFRICMIAMEDSDPGAMDRLYRRLGYRKTETVYTK